MSSATPDSECLRRLMRLDFMVFSIFLLVRIDAVPASVQLHQAQLGCLSIPLRGLNDENDFDIANVRRGIAGAGILAKHRAAGSVTSELEDGLSNSTRKHRGVGRLNYTDLRGPRIVHYVCNVRKQHA